MRLDLTIALAFLGFAAVETLADTGLAKKELKTQRNKVLKGKTDEHGKNVPGKTGLLNSIKNFRKKKGKLYKDEPTAVGQGEGREDLATQLKKKRISKGKPGETPATSPANSPAQSEESENSEIRFLGSKMTKAEKKAAKNKKRAEKRAKKNGQQPQPETKTPVVESNEKPIGGDSLPPQEGTDSSFFGSVMRFLVSHKEQVTKDKKVSKERANNVMDQRVNVLGKEKADALSKNDPAAWKNGVPKGMDDRLPPSKPTKKFKAPSFVHQGSLGTLLRNKRKSKNLPEKTPAIDETAAAAL